MNDIDNPPKVRISRIYDYLIRASKYGKPSILFAVYQSEFHRPDVEKSLIRMLKDHDLKTLGVNAGEYKDIPAYFIAADRKDTVFLVNKLEQGFPEVLALLNFKREDIIEHRIKAVFWVTEQELAAISIKAPDFFAFRNRVVEFMEMPSAERITQTVPDMAFQTEFESLEDIKNAIELKEKLLLGLSEDDEIRGYILKSLGIL